MPDHSEGGDPYLSPGLKYNGSTKKTVPSWGCVMSMGVVPLGVVPIVVPLGVVQWRGGGFVL
jgi:hypothetical protein